MTQEEQTLYSIVTRTDITGKSFICDSIPDSMQAAMKYVKKNDGHLATMIELLRGFPQPTWYTANSEDVSGVDKDNLFGYGINTPVVITSHGRGLLCNNPNRIRKALKEGLNALSAVKLTDDEWNGYVRGELSDGRGEILTWDNFLEESAVPNYIDTHSEAHEAIRVVRSLELARKTDTGYKVLSRLCDAKGKVTDSQVIVYAGGVVPAQKVIDEAKSRNWANLGVYHPFSIEQFAPNEPQGRVLYLGDNGGLGGDSSVSSYASFFGVRR